MTLKGIIHPVTGTYKQRKLSQQVKNLGNISAKMRNRGHAETLGGQATPFVAQIAASVLILYIINSEDVFHSKPEAFPVFMCYVTSSISCLQIGCSPEMKRYLLKSWV